ncbi:hypothetical protein H6A07_03680 [Olsenella uli]|uniref:hypothetical protein n=1 Tax=Olsenella uli TaxID=133926 RepID=UPI0019581240|nr:hypothetical protein [Olsenella uli]MBM6675845.1 hypothetical protein [Olsenella uli]
MEPWDTLNFIESLDIQRRLERAKKRGRRAADAYKELLNSLTDEQKALLSAALDKDGVEGFSDVFHSEEFQATFSEEQQTLLKISRNY